MKRISSTILTLRRAALILLAVLAGIAATAQTGPWTNAEALKPVGSGTQTDPYIVASARNLLWLSVNVVKEGVAGKYYVQVDDIDLEGREWIPIGYSGGGFHGSYDGQGHTISGLSVDWGRYTLIPGGARNSNNYAYGLFGWLGGDVCNLVIDGADIYRSPSSQQCTQDIKVGVLAGTVNPGRDIRITDIVITNSTVRDAGGGGEFVAPAYFIGGFAGDFNASGYAPGSFTSEYIVDIDRIYADVDFDLPNLTLAPGRDWSNKGIQYYVGGLVGRYRSRYLVTKPQTVKGAIYTGTVNAPYAIVGPIFGAARYESAPNDTFEGLRYGFSGDFRDKEKEKGKSTADDFATTYYTGYRVYDYSAGTPTEATLVTPGMSGLYANTLGTATFRPQTSAFTPSVSTTPQEMAAFQGVNRGTYLADAHLQTKAETEVGPQDGDFRWDFSGLAPGMTRRQPVTLTVQKTAPMTYKAVYTTSRPAASATGYKVRWFKISVATTSKAPEELTANASRSGESELLYADNTSAAKTFMVVLYDGDQPLESAVLEVTDYVSVATSVQLVGTGPVCTANLIYHEGATETPLDMSLFDVWHTMKCGSVDYTDFTPVDSLISGTDAVYIVKDHAFKGRSLVVKFKGKGNLNFSIDSPGMSPGVSEYRNIYSTSGLHNYRFRYQYKVDKNKDSEEVQNSRILDPLLSQTITYKYTVAGTSIADEPLPGVVRDTFAIKDVYMSEQIYKITAYDAYGGSYTFSNQTIKGATDLALVVENHQLVPVYTINKAQYTVDKDEALLTYDWQVEYTDGTVETYDTPTLDQMRFCGATITFTATDRLGQQRTATFTYNIDNLRIDVESDGDKYTANLVIPSGLSLDMSGGTWQWYGVNGEITGNIDDYYPLDGRTTSELLIDRTNDNYTAYCAVFTIGGNTYAGYGAKKDIVYVYNAADTKWYIDNDPRGSVYQDIYDTYPDGDDLSNDGRTPRTAARTMARAYALLSETNRAEDNVIVVMGHLQDEDYMRMVDYLPVAEYRRNATITGTYGEITATGNLQLGNSGPQGMNGATIFKDIWLNGRLRDRANGKTAAKELLLYCNLNDFTLSTGVKMEHYNTTSANINGLGDYTAPAITIVGGMHQYNNASLDYPAGNAEKGATTIIMQSGCVGRIIASARTNGKNKTSQNVFGHPDWPHRVNVVVAVKHTTTDGTSDREYYPEGTYKYDVGLLVGGQTDGSVFVDSKINMMSGTVGRFISGNISYGRHMDEGYPDDGFWGSTVLTMIGGEIGELVGGTLGRYYVKDVGPGLSQAYFYGRSIININGGTIRGNIYGGGAGGVVGLGDDDAHTADPTIPYYSGKTKTLPNGDTYRGITYGDYQAAKDGMPVIRLRDEDPDLEADAFGRHVMLDLSKSYCEVNINGGTVDGTVYGGAYGYSKQVAVDNAVDQAGYVFGETRVNVRGGLITGDVFGGGAGSELYDVKKKQYNDTTTAAPVTLDFTRLARVYGNTHVSVMGGVIEGSVYGGSEGIAGYPDMAWVSGDTHVEVSNRVLSDNTRRVPLINNNIYGGSKLGRIKGDTRVDINGGAIGNNIFGGSEGIDDTHTGTTVAVVDGNTAVYITDGSYFTQANSNSITAARRLAPADRLFNIYGGGYNNCIVTGNTLVNIKKSLFASHNNLLEGRDFQDCFSDETYRKFSVYGGGRGMLTDVAGNTRVRVDITGGASVPSTIPVDVANNQQFYMIVGGGYAGNVYGNTDVTLTGNVFADRVYGGCMYGRTEGSATVRVLGGSYHNIYGGGLLGDIRQGANLVIGSRGTSAVTATANRNLYIYNNVYGGNDVGGIVGYTRSSLLWTDTDGATTYPVRVYDKDEATGQESITEYAYTLHDSTEDYGVDIKVYGGHILGDLYGAGNGNHTGYYVPNYATSTNRGPAKRVNYPEGPAYLYRVNSSDPNSNTKNLFRNNANKLAYGLYLYRPRVSKVRVHIGGNTSADRVTIDGSVYGGGHACTIGAFDPTKDVLTDPSRFIGGGSLKLNFGSHVTVGKAVYMGSRGEIVGTQTVIADTDQGHLDPIYDYHFYNPATGIYQLGFPDSPEGRNRFHAYIKLIDMNASAQLTFYNEPGDDPLYRPALFDASDMRWGSFYGGGARGSMTYDNPDTSSPCYEYWLPKGLTVEKRVVGGSEDAQVRFYRYNDDFRGYDTTKPIFTYYGGMVYDDIRPDKTDVDETDPAYSYGHYGGGVVEWHSAPAGTDDREVRVGDESPRGSRVVLRLSVHCDFDPVKTPRAYNLDWDEYSAIAGHEGETEYDEADDIYYGGLVYGGCYDSGITNGSVQIVCSDNMLGTHFESRDYHDYLRWSTLRRNVGRIYGGGFGQETSVWGNTHLRLDGELRCFNVFGGGMLGNVTGGTEIEISGMAKIYNAVYGGGMHADVGKSPDSYTPALDADLYAKGTSIRLVSGGVDRVYGGAFMGDVYGGSHILASDEGSPEGTPRLLVGHIFGGNDVSGTVHPDLNASSPAYGLCTDIRVAEEPRADKKTYTLSHRSDDDPSKYFGGFPLVGSIYGAGNGNMADYIDGVEIDRERHEYRNGKIHIAMGGNADYRVWDLRRIHAADGTRRPATLPDLQSTRVDIRGGTIINVYGGGNMCTPTASSLVRVQYADTVARAAVAVANQDPLTWGTLRLFEDLQQSEVTTVIGRDMRFSYQIYRVFGGNNHMDMDIQPSWELTRGQVFSVYSGGNFGRMTHPQGLSLTLDSPHMRIASVYGGGRVGDITATDAAGTPLTFGAGRYGATLNIRAGVIGDVYGGNNVAGHVHNGTNVNISGAISGNVYCSGNGNYIYLYDHDNSVGDPEYISEGYNPTYGGRYFILPRKTAYTWQGTDVPYGSSPTEKVLAINSYRPSVDRAYLNIEGSAESPVFVLGNVYCGGNSSTVLINPDDPNGGDIRFRIGSHVTLGGVFLGSNGEDLANPFHIAYLADHNGIDDMGAPNAIASIPALADAARLGHVDRTAHDLSLYPNLLSLYMRAAEVTALPTEFTIEPDAVNANIGDFTVGGNRGSMLTDRRIDLEFPENLVIFGRIVGGCCDALVQYKGADSRGGMVKPLREGEGTEKVHLTIRSRFRPWRMLYDADEHTVSLVNDRTDLAGNYVPDYKVSADSTYYYSADRCTIYGGCYTSGKTVGGIGIDLYSDVLGLYGGGGWGATETVGGITRDLTVNRDMLMGNVALRRTVYAISGAGYGALSEVDGDIRVRMLPTPAAPGAPASHPSISTIFGGAHNGQHTGTSTTEVRDGMIFSSLYGGSRAAFKYGSSEVIVGYPEYHRCLTSGIYTIERADRVSYAALATASPSGEYTPDNSSTVYRAVNADGSAVIRQTAHYRAGDIVAPNVVARIRGFQAAAGDAVTPVDDLTAYFAPCHEEPADYLTTWDDIDINIGDNSRMDNPDAHYYGGGGIYGGGHALNESSMSYSGVYTQLAYTADKNPDGRPDSPAVGFGGNSTILVGDNPDASQTRSHISIGTGHYVRARLDTASGDKMGHYVHNPATGRYDHQEAGLPAEGVTYYSMETDGGIHGDGRRTFVQGFRAVDVTGYGYADYTPEHAKLINTFQRIDMLSLNDCCLQLQGAQDYATNSVDLTPYSIARVGELCLNSSIASDAPLQPSVADPNVAGNLSLDVPRSRNYMGFFHSVRYVGAMVSSTAFTDPFHGDDGSVSADSYHTVKKRYIADWEASPQETADLKTFKKRNLGTAPNMIGINNGYTLKLQNIFTTEGSGGAGILDNAATDNIYYGPVTGVFEVKLLTLAQDEGGGYIYAFNHHEDGTNPAHTFLEDTGNFMYAGSIDSSNENYIVDDCHPAGYYDNSDNARDEEVHYWYVQGHKYFFNATLTAYTYNGNEIDFHLNNSDNLIMLSGITPSSAPSIQIKSVHWEDHADDGYECALTTDLDDSAADSREKYQLYLTIDKNTVNSYDLTNNGSAYTNVGNALVARLPNGNAPAGGNAYGTAGDGSIQVANNYSNASDTDRNSPLLGIRLHDTDNQNQNPEFYHSHLEQPDNLVIVIEATDDLGELNTYTIRLNVVYVQGPYISGTLQIENCALPGEYIYANTSGVQVELDESLTVTGKKWYLYPIKKDDFTQEVYSWDKSPEGRVDVTRYLMDNLAGDVNRLQLPARYYQNDWKLGYCVVVNGRDFPLTNTDEDATRLTVHNYHRMSTVADAVRRYTGGGAVDESHGGYSLDLDLVGGALVYIEDDLDFEIFTKYVNYCNQLRTDGNGNVIYHQEHDPVTGTDVHVATLIAEVLPGYNPYGYITGYTNGRTIEGYKDSQDVEYRNIKNPSGAENIRFVLTADVNATERCMPISEFRGQLNGMGHVVKIDSKFHGKDIFGTNYGVIRELGVVSTGGENAPGAPTYVVAHNRGSVLNSYYYHYPEGHPGDLTDFSADTYSSLIGANETEVTSKITHTGVTDNCYQNTAADHAHAVEGLRYRTNELFHDGRIAYNLNQQYLKARYNSRDDDARVRQAMAMPGSDPSYMSIDYMYSYYSDGEYRYAYVQSADHPEGLRMDANFGVPNYENSLGNEQSLHLSSEDIDRSRWFTVPGAAIPKRDVHGKVEYDEYGQPVTIDQGYFPIYNYSALDPVNPVKHSDFLFFGQRLSPGADRDYYPVHVDYDNRVYRATGCYGSRTDHGFHFNREVHAMLPSLTAIDFTGTLDLHETDGSRAYRAGWHHYIYNETSGTAETAYTPAGATNTPEVVPTAADEAVMQNVFYPPMLDLPGGDTSKYVSNLLSFDVISNTSTADHTAITKNLLVYTPEIGTPDFSRSDSDRLFGSLHYTRMQQWGDPQGETPQDQITGHHLTRFTHPTGEHFHAYGGLFHLVDAQDFNAPIEFYVASDDTGSGVTGRAWLLRQPRGYSCRGNAVPDAQGFTVSKDAWESIALPFTANRVHAVNSGDYIEKYSRGEITHFYGDDEKWGLSHHDYWLRGLVATHADDTDNDDVIASAGFARPGVSTASEQLFDLGAEQMTGDYTYENDWFYTTYKDVAYNEHHNDYGSPMLFSRYSYLTKNAPYIVAYPGDEYYEFDLSGIFYNDRLHTTGCHPQEILYEFNVDAIDPGNNFSSQDISVRIPVTDNYDAVRHTLVTGADGTVTGHHATFMRLADDRIADNMYVINDRDISGDNYVVGGRRISSVNVKGSDVEFPAGTAFINCRDFGITEILPFRTYLTVDLPPSPAKRRMLVIGTPTAHDEAQPEPDEPVEPQTPADEIDGMRVWVDGTSLMVSVPGDTEMYIHNTSGQTVRYIRAYRGTNRYTGLPAGFYIVGGTKVRIP